MKNVTREDRVAYFNRAAGKTPLDEGSEGGGVGLYVSNFSEELAEFAEAVATYSLAHTEENRAHMIKEWADVQYTLSSFPWYFGFDADAAFNRVANSNDSKVVDGKLIIGENGKVLKPIDYHAPDMKGL